MRAVIGLMLCLVCTAAKAVLHGSVSRNIRKEIVCAFLVTQMFFGAAFGAVIGGVVKIDPNTGVQTLLSSGGLFAQSVDFVFISPNEILISNLNAINPPPGHILTVNLSTGAQAVTYSGGSLVQPTGMITYGGGILVADISTDSIIEIDAAGTQTVISSGGGFVKPRAMAVEPSSGDIIVADENTFCGGNGALWRIDATTHAKTVVPGSCSGVMRYPMYVAFDANGDILVTARFAGAVPGAVIRVDAVSGLQTVVTSGNLLGVPVGFEIDSNGDLWIADLWIGETLGRIVKVNPATGTQTLIASGGLLVNPAHVHFDGNGDLIVSDFGVPEPPPVAPIAKVLIANYAGDLIETRYIDGNGVFESQILDTTPTGDGPCSLTLSPSGNTVYVGNCGDSTAQAFSIDPVDDNLTPLGPTVATATSPKTLYRDSLRLIVCDPSGFAYSYPIDPETEEIVPPGVPVTTQTCNDTPAPVAITPATGLATPPAGNNAFVYVVSKCCSVTRYSIDVTTGELGSAVTDSIPITGGFSTGAALAVVPSNSSFAYIKGGNAAGDVSGLSVDPLTGSLTAVTGSPFPGPSQAMSIADEPGGRFVYAGHYTNPTDGTISAYSVGSDGGLTQLGSPFPLAATVAPEYLAFDPSGGYAFACGSDGGGVGHLQAYTVDSSTGSITPTGSAVPTGGTGGRTVVAPSGKFLYVANTFGVSGGSVAGTIGAFRISETSGALTAIAGSPYLTTAGSGIAANDIAVNPGETHLYVLRSDNFISAYAIDTATGALTEIAGSPFATAADTPVGLAIDASGSFLYALLDSSGGSFSNISAYLINPVTGALAPVTGSPFATGLTTHAEGIFITR